jgi:trimeric autotransporter adhesin
VKLSHILALALTVLVIHSTTSSAPGVGQNDPIPSPQPPPLSRILKPDGSLDLGKGFSGSLDARGYRLVTGTDGAPRFIPVPDGDQAVPRAFERASAPESNPDDVYWDDQFPLSGTDLRVCAAAVDASGRLYIAGDFSVVGTAVAQRVAMWDGTAWSALGSGMNNSVCALAVNGDNLYAGGAFTTAGDAAANRVAKWDGSSWSSLASGTNATVYALAVNGDDLFVGGAFTTAGEVSAPFVAKWSGSSWSSLGPGMNGSVYALAVTGADLYAGGDFTTAGGNAASLVAKWNGSTWSALGVGIAGTMPTVRALAVSGSNLYVGGTFAKAGGTDAANIARWDGSTWSALGGGTAGTVIALVVTGNDLFVGGSFQSAGGMDARGIARWDGTSWSALGAEMENYAIVRGLAAAGGNLYAGGQFTLSGGVGTANIAKWSGGAWSALGEGMGGSTPCVEAAAVHGNSIVVGGQIVRADGLSVSRVAEWDGVAWSALGGGIDNAVDPPYVSALAVCGGSIYAGGNFRKAGGATVNHIAQWNGSSWSAMGAGMDGRVFALAADGGNVYAGGEFSKAGEVTVNRIARWDGSSWSALGSGVDNNVLALAVSGGTLYAGGGFTTAGGVSAQKIAKWDGTSWHPVGGGLGNSVFSLATSGGNLYAGTLGANNVVVWDGSTWSPVGDGILGSQSVFALASDGTNLFAGGDFAVARWDGASWSTLGSGVNHTVRALAVAGRSLFVGGGFTVAGGKVSYGFAQWQPRVNVTTVTVSATPGLMTIGNDVYGFYKPALVLTTGTTVSCPGGMPATVTLDRAEEIHVGGKRINGAFTVSPEGLGFGGDAAALLVEFSEDDAALFGRPWTEFRAVSLTYPAGYPVSMEAATTTVLAGQSAPFTARIENGRRICAIIAPVTNCGGTYGAVPGSVAGGQMRADDTFSTCTQSWCAMAPGTSALQGIAHDIADSTLKVAIMPDASRVRTNGWFTLQDGVVPQSSVGAANCVRGRYFVFTGGQSNPSALNAIPAVRMRLSNRFAVTSMLEVFNHLNADSGVSACAQELRPSADPQKPSVYTVDFDPVDVPYLAANADTEGIMRAFEAYSSDPQDNGFIALKECAVSVYPSSLLDAGATPVKVYQPTASDAGNLTLGLDGSALVAGNFLFPAAEGVVVAASDPMASLPTHKQGPEGVTLDTATVPANRIGAVLREFTPGPDVTAPDYLRVEQGRVYKIRWHLTSTQQSNLNSQIRMRARSVKFMFTHKLEVGGAWATGLGTVTSNNAIAQQALPGIGTLNPDHTGSETGGWYTQLYHSPLDPAIRPEDPLAPLSQRMPNLAAQPGPQQPGGSLRDLRVGLDMVDTITQTPNSPLEKGNITVDRIEIYSYPDIVN